MKQYRIVCDDNDNQCGPEFQTPEQVEFCWRTYTEGHDGAHGHIIQVREVSDWTAYVPIETLAHEGVGKLIEASETAF